MKPIIPQCSESLYSKILLAVKSAKRPVFLIGSQVILGHDLIASGKLPEAIKNTKIPIVLTGAARGFMGKSYQYQVIQKNARRTVLKEADVVVLVGTPCDFRLNYGFNIGAKVKLISINRSKRDLYLNRTPSIPVLADPATVLFRLATDIGDKSSQIDQEWLEKALQSEKKRWIRLS